MSRSLSAALFWTALLAGILAAMSSATSIASFVLGAEPFGHSSAILRLWYDALRFGLAVPVVAAMLRLAGSIGALPNSAGHADE